MGYGHSIGYGLNGLDWLITLLIVGFIFLYILRFINKGNGSNNYTKILYILKERYAKGEIDSDEYVERKVVIEDTEFPEPVELILLERYAKGEINTEEFYSIKNEVNTHDKLFY